MQGSYSYSGEMWKRLKKNRGDNITQQGDNKSEDDNAQSKQGAPVLFKAFPHFAAV